MEKEKPKPTGKLDFLRAKPKGAAPTPAVKEEAPVVKKEAPSADAKGKGKATVAAGKAKAKEAPGEGAYDYDRLFGAARDNFIATSDTALRALLGEFRDHGLVVTVAAAQGGAEAMWIPMRRDALLKIVGDLQAEGL